MIRRRILLPGLVVAVLVANVAVVRAIRGWTREGPQITPAPAGHRDILADAGIRSGRVDARVRVWILGDYECPACARLEATAGERLRTLAERGEIHLAYVHTPLEGRQHGRLSASASYCARRENRPWELHRWLYETSAEWMSAPDPREALISGAHTVGIDSSRFRACLSDPAIGELVAHDLMAGRRLGVDRVPIILVDDTRVRLRRSGTELLAHLEQLITQRGLRAEGRR